MARPSGIIEELSQLSVEQLKQLEEQLSGELSYFQESLNDLKTASERYDDATKALQNISEHPDGKKLLVPLTEALFVPGTLHNANKILVDVGTGYYIEKTIDEGKEYCERRINLLKGEQESLIGVAAHKKNVLEQVNMVSQAKQRAMASSK